MKSLTTKFTRTGYTLVAEIHKGEGELVVVCSPGQSGHVALYIVAIGCDGGYSGVEPLKDYPYGQLTMVQAEARVRAAALEFFDATAADAVLKEFQDMWRVS